MERRSSFFVLLIAIIIIMSGFTIIRYYYLNAVSPKHDELIIVVSSHIDPGNFDPWNSYSPTWCILDQIYSFLGMYVPGLGMHTMSGLAENWTISADRTEWSFTLQEGLTFHDGRAITAKDVEYSFKASAAYGPYNFYWIDNITDPAFEERYYNITYDSPDSRTFTVSSKTKFPDPMFEGDISGNWRAFTIIPEGSMETNEAREAFWKKPISAGPYMLNADLDYQSGETLTLTRFDEWFGWGQSFNASNGLKISFPKMDKAFKEIQFRFIDDPEIQLIELTKTYVDVVLQPSVDWFTSISQVTYNNMNTSDDLLVVQHPRLGGTVLMTNIQGDWPTIYGGPGNFPVSEVWFRQAVSHAINRTDIVEHVFNGIGASRSTIFPNFITEEYTNLNTTGYYDFSMNLTKAQLLLDNAGYTPLNFTQEPDNRFGYGIYANETKKNGEIQEKGRHFTILTLDCSLCVLRGYEVQKDLRAIGIYTDLIPVPQNPDEFLSYVIHTPGCDYDNETVPQPDPAYQGADIDFLLWAMEAILEAPNSIISYTFPSFGYWYNGWTYPECGWLNEDFEIGRYKFDGNLFGNTWWLWDFFDPPLDMPENGYPIPEWSNDDSQYIEGCIQAGKTLSEELPVIPLVWYIDTYLMNANVKNLLFTHTGRFHVAYAYWD